MTTTSPPPVTRFARALDLVALALASVGAAAYARAYLGMRELQTLTGTSPFAGAAMIEFNRWWRLSRLGIAILLLAMLTAGAAAVAGRRSRPAPAA